MSTGSSSYIVPEPESADDSNDLDSLPESGATSSTDEDVDLSDAEREWRESLQQLELILTMVLIPYIGKYFGRKLAYWGKATYEQSSAPESDMTHLGWAKYMEWQYPVNVVITSPSSFKGAGAIEAAATL